MAVDKLQAFIERNKITRGAAARALHISTTWLYQILSRTADPSDQLKRDIEVWTGGEVPASSWPSPTRHSNVKPFVKVPAKRHGIKTRKAS
jgi:hypothetical protein